MRKAHYWLLLKIAEMPKAFTYGAGILIACVLILATLVTTTLLDRNQVAEQHENAIATFREIALESSEVLAHLHTHTKLECRNEDLTHLNAHLLKSRYLREIGLLDDKRRLVCSTAMGPLETPIMGNYPVYTARSGLELLNRVPLAMAEQQLEAMIIVNHPFNVVVSPFATGDIYNSADIAWLRGQEDLILLHANVDSETIAAMQVRAARQTVTDLALHGFSYELISLAPDTDIVLQTRRDLKTIVRNSGILLPGLLAGSLLIAVLAVGTITPYVIKLSHLRNRIGFLCNEAHLALVYQPIFDLTNMRLVGCEVLARLKEGNKTWRPDEIIPAIQQVGLEYEFDQAITRKAIQELSAHLPACEGNFEVALNYFPESMRPGKLVPVLTRALQVSGRHDLKICVEITEHSFSNEVIAEVAALRAQGFLIAVDDFGTGYSNLRTVTQVSPDILKIDRSFVFELEEAGLRSNLIPEIVNIARAVDAQTIAEGIETLEQARLLATAGVRYGQGYALARPMEMTQFIAFMSNYQH